VARLTFIDDGGGSWLCTGGLVSDKLASPSWEYYLLTANHCFDSETEAASLTAYFDYRSSTCGGSPPSLGSVPQSNGADLLATNAGSDFTFVRLDSSPGGTRFWFGWTTGTPTAGQTFYSISNPAGQKLHYTTTSFNATGGITCNEFTRPAFHYSSGLTGSTTGGSSGSPMYNSTGQIMGQLYGTCHLPAWDTCSYSTFNRMDGGFGTTFPSISQWIDDEGFDLTVTKSGSGAGTVTSNLGGISCGSTCAFPYLTNTLVNLTATAAADSHFVGWSGSCAGSSPTYGVTMDAHKSCNAEFDGGVGPYQEIYANPNPVAAQPGGDVWIDVMYDVSDADATLTGIGIRVHYDSSMLTFDPMDFTLAFGRLFDPFLVVSEADSSDFDGDASTDRFISLAWVDFGNNSWPGSLPQPLASPHFIATAGFNGSTQVNFSASDLAAGYSLNATPATVFEQPCTLDTDGNGSDGALTDGVLDVRYLFGFTGAQLTNGAIGVGATRTDAASIITYLGGCPAMLDVDGDGSAGALTDGVLIVRYLFGFTGAQLTDGAVGPGCTRCDATSIIAFLNTHDTTSAPASQASAGEQLVSSRVNRSSSGRNGKTIDVQVDYLTTQRSLTGLGLRMHFDSSKLSLVELSNIFSPGALQHQVQEDTLDFDGDPKTDRYINIVWMDHMGSWPGTDQTQLFTATFQMAKSQGSGATTIRYSVTDVAAGMDVYLEPVNIGPGNSTKAR